jgi:uncharacterized Zn-finger protein
MDLEQVFIKEEIADTIGSQNETSDIHENEAALPYIKLELTEAIKKEPFEIKEETVDFEHSSLPLNHHENIEEIPEIKEETIENFEETETKSVNENFVDVFEKKNDQNFKLGETDPLKFCSPTLDSKEANKRRSNKLHSCLSCNSKFPCKSKLKRHVESVHEKRKPHKCNACNADYTNVYALNKHVELVHEGKKPFQCEICDAKYTEKGSLKKHCKKAHGVELEVQCNFCDGLFLGKDY